MLLPVPSPMLTDKNLQVSITRGKDRMVKGIRKMFRWLLSPQSWVLVLTYTFQADAFRWSYWCPQMSSFTHFNTFVYQKNSYKAVSTNQKEGKKKPTLLTPPPPNKLLYSITRKGENLVLFFGSHMHRPLVSGDKDEACSDEHS